MVCSSVGTLVPADMSNCGYWAGFTPNRMSVTKLLSLLR